MKRLVSILLVLFVANVTGQTTRFNIQKDFYGSGDNATAVTEVKGGYLVLGNNIGPSSERFVTFCKIDSIGNEIWRKEYLKSGANCFVTKGINNYIDSTIIYVANYQFPSGNISGGVMKATMSGDTLLHKIMYDTSFDSQTHTIQRLSNGDYLISGSSDEFDFYADIWLMRTDSLFNQIWIQYYPMAGTYEFTTKVHEMLNGDFLISSSTYNFSTQIVKPRLIITDSLGNFKREKTYGSTAFSNGVPIAFQTDINEIWSFAFEGDFFTGSTTSGDVNLKRFDTSLNVLDTLFVHDGGDTYGGIKDVILESNYVYAVTIIFNWAIMKNSMTLLKYDYSSYLLRQRMYDVYDWADLASQLIKTSDGGFMMIGTTQAYTMTQDWKMVKTDSLGCDTLGCEIYDNIEELPIVQKYTHIEVYPNPATDIVYLKIDNKTGFDFLGGSIELYDNMGKLIFQKHVAHNFDNLTQITLADLPQGIYIGRVSVKNNVIGNFKIVKQ